MACRTVPPFRLDFSGDENLSRLDPDRLKATDAARLGTGAGGTVFLIDEGAATATLTVSKESPNYTGEVHLDINATNDTLIESYKLTCTPRSSEVDRLLVHFFPACPEPLAWEMLMDGKRTEQDLAEPVVVRKLSAAAQAKQGIFFGEVWEVSWRRSRSSNLPPRSRANKRTWAILAGRFGGFSRDCSKRDCGDSFECNASQGNPESTAQGGRSSIWRRRIIGLTWLRPTSMTRRNRLHFR